MHTSFDSRKIHPLSVGARRRAPSNARLASSEQGEHSFASELKSSTSSVRSNSQNEGKHSEKSLCVAKARGPKTRQFTVEQLEILDTQVEREVRREIDEIYRALRKRLYPGSSDQAIFGPATMSHRLHSAYRVALRQVNVPAIRSRVANRLEKMVSGGDHSEEVGFDFLLNMGESGSKDRASSTTIPASSNGRRVRSKPDIVAESSSNSNQQGRSPERHGKYSESSNSESSDDEGAGIGDGDGDGDNRGMGRRKRLRGAALWRYIVKKKHWKALVPYVEPPKPWEQPRFLNLPKNKIDIRGWVAKRKEQTEMHNAARLEWLRDQWSRKKGPTRSSSTSGDGLGSKSDMPDGRAAAVENENVSTDTPACQTLRKQLALHTRRLKPNVLAKEKQGTINTRDKMAWSDIVASLQAQGVLPKNFNTMWEPMRRPFPPRRGAREEPPSSNAEQRKEHPHRLGRYLLPNHNLIRPDSKGTLDDYYKTLNSNSPEMNLLRVASAVKGDDSASFIRDRGIGICIGRHTKHHGWFKVPAGELAPGDKARLEPSLRENALWANTFGATAIGAGRRLGGVHSALPSGPLTCSAFAPNSWNHHRAREGEGFQKRWAAFLPEGASIGDAVKAASRDWLPEADAKIRREACQTVLAEFSQALHHQRTATLEVHTGGKDPTVGEAVSKSNPMVGGGGGAAVGAGAAAVAAAEEDVRIPSVRISGVSHESLQRLLQHLKEYLDLGPERLHVPFCPANLGRVMSKVEALAVQTGKKEQALGRNQHLVAAAAAVGAAATLSSASQKNKSYYRRKKRRPGLRGGGLMQTRAPNPKPLPFAVADELGTSARALQYAPRIVLSIVHKYTTMPWCAIATDAATMWRRASVSTDRLEGLAFEISRRAGALGRIGSPNSSFHAAETKQIVKWNMLTLLNEFDMACRSVRAIATIMFVRFREILRWGDDLCVDRIAKMRATMRREMV